MKVSYNWLKDYIAFDYDPHKLSEILTDLGLEVGGLEEIGGVEGNLEGVVVGHVLSAEQHPNADRLKVCKVEVGQEEPLQIVCGAPNVAAGQKVPVSLVGTTLYPISGDPFKIKKGKIRGEVSMGMICAEDELGLGTDHDGIMVLAGDPEPGTPVNQVIELDKDYIIEIDLTPNRIDGASHYGVARDLGAFMRKKARLPEISYDPTKAANKNPIPVTIEDASRCKRYLSIYIEDVTVNESPEWLKKRLTAIGLRPINNVVDITNYVLMELGHPLHAFDADQIGGQKVIVKTLEKETPFVTLDEVERKLVPHEDLMICDASKPLCIGGTMGGIDSGVTFETKNVFLECAYFIPGTVRKSAKRHGIHSDSSFRYERGVDMNMEETTIKRATDLILTLAGGTASQMEDIRLDDFAPFPVELEKAHIHRLIGKEIPLSDIKEIFDGLEMKVVSESEEAFKLAVPAYRVDVQRPQDVIEDILRVYGYNNVAPSIKMNASVDFSQKKEAYRLKERYADYLSANGFYEILNNSLVHQSRGSTNAVFMVNPLSEDQSVLRENMVYGVLESILYNQNRQNEDVALYEFGRTYHKKQDKYEEKEWLVMAVTGTKQDIHWGTKPTLSSLFTLTKEVERISQWFRIEGSLEEGTHELFDYGLAYVVRGRPLLHYGRVKQTLLDQFDLRNEVFYLELDWNYLAKLHDQQKVLFQEIPIYPGMRRDFSLLIDEQIKFQDLRRVVAKTNPKLIKKVELYDVYQGKGVAEGKKSYLISVLLRDDNKSLEGKSADKISDRITANLAREFQAELRK
ncbi:MAG: phenylalanine--tRNA ligase subunit beta [Bacteroidota bacterium]